ncbi:hypothetical protein NX059_012327 [Plenodomus lindquistii]|nr:hypothetical protein NX059_012327 [Plenodomus lindquistii]
MSTLYSTMILNKDNVAQGTTLLTTLIAHPERAENITHLKITANFATVFPTNSWLPLYTDQRTIDERLNIIPSTIVPVGAKERNTVA